MQNTKKKYFYCKKKRLLKKIVGTMLKPRLSIYKSNKHIYSQLINDINGITICSCSTVDKEFLTNKKFQKLSILSSYSVGEDLGLRAKKKNIYSIIFDRNYQLYHGNIKKLIEGVRSQGIIC